MRSLLALTTCALTACALPPSQSLTPEQQQQMAENQRPYAATLAHSNDGGSTASIIAHAMLDAQSPSSGQQVQKLMLFGGQGHNTYLGCLNCDAMASDSVLNSYGNFGSSYGPNSIFNSFSEYGSSYSSYSACSTYAADPPVIVDSAGSFYGRLTVNAMNPQRANNLNLQTWLTAVCNR